MTRRRPLLPYEGLDIEPQPAPPMMQPMPQMEFMPMDDANLAPLAQMGTQRALQHLLRPKKKSASPADALAAWEAGGSL